MLKVVLYLLKRVVCASFTTFNNSEVGLEMQLQAIAIASKVLAKYLLIIKPGTNHMNEQLMKLPIMTNRFV